jgi:hypothetical protein
MWQCYQIDSHTIRLKETLRDSCLDPFIHLENLICPHVSLCYQVIPVLNRLGSTIWGQLKDFCLRFMILARGLKMLGEVLDSCVRFQIAVSGFRFICQVSDVIQVGGEMKWEKDHIKDCNCFSAFKQAPVTKRPILEKSLTGIAWCIQWKNGCLY